MCTSALHGPGLGPRAAGRPGPWAGPGRAWMTYLRAGPGAGLKVVGPGRARASQSHLCGLRAGPGPNLHGPGPAPGLVRLYFKINYYLLRKCTYK